MSGQCLKTGEVGRRTGCRRALLLSVLLKSTDFGTRIALPVSDLIEPIGLGSGIARRVPE